LVEELIKTKKIENNSNTRIMIVSGCHGKPNGEDGFSNSETRDPNLFRKDLDLADDYHLENTNGQSIMEGYLQVINISWFKIQDSRKIEGQIRRPDPDVIILPWNYSFGGDFHTALRKELEIKKYGLPGVAQIRFYLVILWKSQEISLLIKVFCLLSDYSKTCTKYRSTIEDLFHKVSLKLLKR